MHYSIHTTILCYMYCSMYTLILYANGRQVFQMCWPEETFCITKKYIFLLVPEYLLGKIRNVSKNRQHERNLKQKEDQK